MRHSTASTKSACLTLALLALTSSPAAASALDQNPPGDGSICESCSLASERDGGATLFDSATIVHRVPIHLPSLDEDDDRDTTAQRNATMEGFELPAELAALIAAAKSKEMPNESSPAAATEGSSGSSDVRYYATYAEEGESCSSKSASAFEGWEETFASLEDCCDVAFGWDYDACMGL